MAPFDTVCFLSDFGLADEFVGVVHRVVQRLAPQATVIDLTHEVPSHDVRAGALALWRAAPWLAPAVVLAVVDPGVGTARRPVAVETAGGALILVGPDNGLLVPAAHRDGPPARAVVLNDPAWHLPPAVVSGRPTGATFDGRDVFGPVAGHLCAGADLGELGEQLDPAQLVGAPLTLASGSSTHLQARGLEVEVLWVDRYGNAQLGVLPETLDALGASVAIRTPPAVAPRVHRVAVRARAYGELAAGQLGLIPDSVGLLALCLDRGSAAADLGLRAGATVQLSTAPEAAPPDAAEVHEPGPA